LTTICCPELFTQQPHHPELNEKFHSHSQENISNVLFWNDIYRRLATEEVEFDTIVECGVGRGRSLITLAAIREYYEKLNLLKSPISIYGLDSFEGFPKPSIEDASWRNPKAGEWSHSPSGNLKYTPDLILEIFRNANVSTSNLELVKGFFNDTTPFLAAKEIRIGILHCDGDLYHSVKSPLDNLNGKIAIGGVIVFDDFLENGNEENDAFPGARKAFNEFISSNADSYEKIWSPRGNVILKKTA